MRNSFLHKIISQLLEEKKDLSELNLILPGKRPLVFIKEILLKENYSGFSPNFLSIEDLITKLSDKILVQGINLWLFAFDIYKKLNPNEDLGSFLKWFPTLLKDWDDMLKFSNDQKILEYMFDEERIKNWGESLGEENNARNRNLNFWKKMNSFLPLLRKELEKKNWATIGMIHQEVREKTDEFSLKTDEEFIFCGFNAFTPTEEKLVRKLLQQDKAKCFFQADDYYIKDPRQEAGTFLRKTKTWKEFGQNRPFQWTENDFSKPKNISVYEVAGNISQTKVLPNIFEKLSKEKNFLDNTAVVLLDENLLPATLEAVKNVESLNITMGFPIKNLAFSNAIRKLFHLHKQLEKNSSSYYYADVFPILEEFPISEEDKNVAKQFISFIEERNIIYISKKMLNDLLGELSFFHLFEKPKTHINFLEDLINFCNELKFQEISDIEYENISLFEKSFKILVNQIQPYSFEINMEVLEVLVGQIINSENINFEGEPLSGLQIMGLLETRLLNFPNLILLSANEGKLPLGNSQNTYIPFDVRKNFGLNTFLENDSIYAYHFYRLIQDSKEVHLLYNSNTSGTNTGEKSRFITQLEIESPHKINHIVIENDSQPVSQEPISIEKTPQAREKLEEWKQKISASHLTTYLYNPLDFYFNIVLDSKQVDELEEELSVKNYGNLIHYALHFLYEQIKGKILIEKDLEDLLAKSDEAILFAITEKLQHQIEYYKKGMNYIHKSIAKRSLESIIQYDLDLVKKGHALQIIDLEKKLGADFLLDNGEKITFKGFADRIDLLDGTLRIIDYKTATANKLELKPKEEQLESFLINNDYKQALQLSIYAYCILNSKDMNAKNIESGIWSFSEINKGVQTLSIFGENKIDPLNISTPMKSISKLIEEILDSNLPFVEKV